ncbi:MAG: hypothetical protein M3Q14_02570 [bacterium]|nr:hypothetical protein [bacterium]
MNGKRAYFTPSAEATNTLVTGLILGGKEIDTIEVSFLVDKAGDTPSDRLPTLLEVTLFPVTAVCATETGFEIRGKNKEIPAQLGRLSIDTTVEPPIAMFFEEEGVES